MKAHKFQEKYTGVQIFIWHSPSEDHARSKFNGVVMNPDNWVFLEMIEI